MFKKIILFTSFLAVFVGSQAHASTLIEFDASHSKNAIGFRNVSLAVEFPSDKSKAPILRGIRIDLSMFTVGYNLEFSAIRSYKYNPSEQVMTITDKRGKIVKVNLNSKIITIPGIINGTYGMVGHATTQEQHIQTSYRYFHFDSSPFMAWQADAMAVEELPFVD